MSPEPHSGSSTRRRYSFGDFTLDLEHGLLSRGGEQMILRPKSFEVLAHLVERHGQPVTKTELIDAVWPDTAVTDNSLAQCVVEIRRALEDDSQQLIRTVARRGYIFRAPVTTSIAESPRQAEPGQLRVEMSPHRRKPAKRGLLALAALVLLALAIAALPLARQASREPGTSYTQITNFTDSAVAPVLSPDGRMVAFLRSDRWFVSTDQIYVKLLPDGEPAQLSHDPRPKYGMAFSPDGSRLAYTVVDRSQMGWNTYTLSVLGGEPSLLLSNASGLTWLDPDRFLFAEQDGRGAHMGIVTAKENRADYRQIYFPPHDRTMAHFANASPDRKWALVMQMDPTWHRCRLISLDSGSATREVGPDGRCMSAAWSPDGKWMYFGAEVEGGRHLWRQRFPSGNPEQITHGAAQEDGVAVLPDGRSLITSIGMEQTAIWIHDAQGERALHSEGYLEGMRAPSRLSVRFSSDGKLIFYLRRDSPQSPCELWRTDLESGRHEAVLRGVSITEYDLSPDNREVVFSTQFSGKAPKIWLAPLDRSSPPKLVTASGGAWPVFGPDNQVLFLWSDGKANYLVRIGRDGSNHSKVFPHPVGNIDAVSPDRRWIAVQSGKGNTVAVPTRGGNPRPIYRVGTPAVAWSANGKFLYVGVRAGSLVNRGKTVAIPVPPGKTLPDLPPAGILGLEEAKALPGARILDGWNIAPGPDPSIYAYTKTTVHRNLYRVPIPH